MLPTFDEFLDVIVLLLLNKSEEHFGLGSLLKAQEESSSSHVLSEASEVYMGLLRKRMSMQFSTVE